MIVLLTDFGVADVYVGVMKGVIATLAPGLPVVDLSHGVPPQDVLAGALWLDASWRHFPAGTTFVVIVDPGVGTSRRALAVRSAGHWFVGPDNGLFSLVPEGTAYVLPGAWALPSPSNTFHGRDIFAPAAARLATGGNPDSEVPWNSLVSLHIPAPDGPRGEVLWVDGYGNLVTNLIDPATDGVKVGTRSARRVTTYGAGSPGELVVLTGSTGRLEVSVVGGNAAQDLGVGRGAPVVAVLP